MQDFVGYLAAFLTTVCYVPQALHVILRRDTAAVSLPAYCMLFCGVASWFVYGLLIGSWPVILANGISLIPIGFILVMKWRLG
jgi:MtN3 and saliva related transmembrane protein